MVVCSSVRRYILVCIGVCICIVVYLCILLCVGVYLVVIGMYLFVFDGDCCALVCAYMHLRVLAYMCGYWCGFACYCVYYFVVDVFGV